MKMNRGSLICNKRPQLKFAQSGVFFDYCIAKVEARFESKRLEDKMPDADGIVRLMLTKPMARG